MCPCKSQSTRHSNGKVMRKHTEGITCHPRMVNAPYDEVIHGRVAEGARCVRSPSVCVTGGTAQLFDAFVSSGRGWSCTVG